MEKIDGKLIAEKIYERMGDKARGLKLVIFSMGENKATDSFIAQKKRAAEKTGVECEIKNFSKEATTEELLDEIEKASKDDKITAIITQLPLYSHIDQNKIIEIISPQKDVDCLNKGNFIAPPVGVVLEILKFLKKEISFANIAVVGHGRLVGKPVYDYFSEKAASIRLLKRGDDFNVLKKAEIVVSGTGSPGIIVPDMLNEGTIIIDFGCGINQFGKIEGDFNPKNSKKNILFTPVPGGTGPILVAKLFENIFSIRK